MLASDVDRFEDICLYYKKKGHWKCDCRKYLADLKNRKQKKKPAKAPTSGLHVIELNLSASKPISWIFDIGCGTYICIVLQGLEVQRRLTPGEVDLRVGNGQSVAVRAVETFRLAQPLGLVIILLDCFYVHSIARNIISVSCFDRQGFYCIFQNNSCSFV